MTIRTPTITLSNVLLANSSDVSFSLSSFYSFERVSVNVVHLPRNVSHRFRVNALCKHVVVVLSGIGRCDETDLKPYDCLGFLPNSIASFYHITSVDDNMNILVVQDKVSQSDADSAATNLAQPQIINALESLASTKWTGTVSHRSCEITRVLGLHKTVLDRPNTTNAWNVLLVTSPPGCKTSNAHAHSCEDELVIMMKGHARFWDHGAEPEEYLSPGMVVGWKAGTGIAHTLINDGGNGPEGEEFLYLVFGENNRAQDQLYYPGRPEFRRPEKRWINGRPEIPLGGASQEPNFPRVEE